MSNPTTPCPGPGYVWGTLPPIPQGHVISGNPNHFGYARHGQFSAGPEWYNTQGGGTFGISLHRPVLTAVTASVPFINGNAVIGQPYAQYAPYAYPVTFPNVVPGSGPATLPSVAPAAADDAEIAKLTDRVKELESDNRAVVKELGNVHQQMQKMKAEMDQLKQLFAGVPETQRSSSAADYWK